MPASRERAELEDKPSAFQTQLLFLKQRNYVAYHVVGLSKVYYVQGTRAVVPVTRLVYYIAPHLILWTTVNTYVIISIL